jgi:hypothetical protein
MIYASARPNAPFSIVVWTIVLLSNVVWFGFLLIPLRDWSVFERVTKRRRLAQLVGVLFSSTVIFAFAERGIWYALLALIQPSAIPANPEVVTIVVPTLAAILVIVFRLSYRLKLPPLFVVSRIAEDIIFASLALFLFVSIIEILRVQPIDPLSEITPNFPLGFLTGIIGLGAEFVALNLKDYLKHRYGSRYVKSKLTELFSLRPLLSLFDRDRQAKLSDFIPPEEIPVRESWSERRLGFSIFGRSIRGSRVTGFLFVAIIIAWTILNIPIRLTALVPGWQVNVKTIPAPVGPSSIVHLSDQIESASPRQYLIPLVQITEGNQTLVAPLDSRLLSINSTNFLVKDTGNYLSVDITEVRILGAVETTLLGYIFSPNITSSEAFSYQGLFRDAEIYYSLYSFGYRTIISLCNRVDSNTISKIFKTIFAMSAAGQYAVVNIYVEWETTTLNDTTLFRSPDSRLNRGITELISLAKINTDFHVELTEPPIPFRLPNSLDLILKIANVITKKPWE